MDTTADEAANGEKRKPKRVIAAEWLEDQFRERREWLSDEINRAAREAGVKGNALSDASSDRTQIRKSPNRDSEGKCYWTWTACPGWPPEPEQEGAAL